MINTISTVLLDKNELLAFEESKDLSSGTTISSDFRNGISAIADSVYRTQDAPQILGDDIIENPDKYSFEDVLYANELFHAKDTDLRYGFENLFTLTINLFNPI